MKNILILSVVLMTAFFSAAQQSLTLPEAVLGQYSKFRPSSVYGFSWIPNSSEYAYIGGRYDLLIKGSVNGDNDTLLSLDEVNNALGSEFDYLAYVTWKDENNIYVFQNNKFGFINVATKKGSYAVLPEEGANFELHPASGRIAFTIDNNIYVGSVDSDLHKAVTSIEDVNIVSGQAIARSEFGISGGLFWSPDGNYLAFYQKDESKVHDYPLLDLNAYPGKLKSIKYPMAGQDSERAKIGIFNIATSELNYIDPKTGVESYLTNVSWTPNEQQLLFAEVNRGQDHMWLQVYSNKGEFVKTVFEEKSETWVEPERPAIFYNGSNDLFAWVSERDGFDNLYLYSIEKGFQKQLTENEFPVKSIEFAADGTIYFSATGENPLNTLIYKVDEKGKQKLLTKQEGTHSAAINHEFGYLFTNYSAHDVPGRSVILKGAKEVKELVSAKDPYVGYNISPAEIGQIEAEDGTTLYTRMIKPHDFDETKKYPVLIYVYGGPHAQLIKNSWMDGASLWMHYLADQDYIVYTVDNRGSANRGANFEHVIHRQLGKAELEDQLKGVEYLKSLPYVDGERIAVHGWSFGGFMTGTMMTKAADEFNVGVAGGLVTDWKYYEIMYGERYMDRPGENEQGYKEASLIENAALLKDHLLMIHGTTDNVVVMQHNLALVKRFVELGIQVDFFPYPMHEHNVYGKDRIHLIEKILNYIIEHNQ